MNPEAETKRMTTKLQAGSFFRVLGDSFLGHTPRWYKGIVAGGLLCNGVVFAVFGPQATGWLILAEFIFTLAMALKCFPLQPGGLLALQAVVFGLTDTDAVYQERSEEHTSELQSH